MMNFRCDSLSCQKLEEMANTKQLGHFYSVNSRKGEDNNLGG